MKKANLILISSIFLFIFINASLVQAGTVTVKVQYQGGCPRSVAYVREVYARNYNVGVTDENGYTSDTGFQPYTIYRFKAYYPNLAYQFGGQEMLYTDGDGNGNVVITDLSDYPNGTESCGSTGCAGHKYCYSGSPNYVQCDSWQTDCGKCCQCNGGTQWNPSQNYDSSQNGDCSATSCSDSCDIDSNPFTWDYTNDEPNYCSSIFTCTNNQCNYQHACADADIYDGVFAWESIIRGCTAECDQTTDYKLIGSTCSYNCDSTNTCSYQNSCSVSSFCNGDIRNYNGGCSAYGCAFSTEDCNQQDGWYDTTTTQWVSIGQCTEKEQVWQEYRDYTCSAASCAYSVTGNKWIDTGNTRDKPNGIICDDSLFCTINDQCSSGVCSGSPRNCADSFSCTDDSCDENIDTCVNAPDNNECTFPQTCSPLFQPPTGCGYSTAPIVTIISPLTFSQNKTNVTLNFIVDRPSVWTYSLDNTTNKTITGPINMTLTNGNHTVIVYAKDSNNNVGSSTTNFNYCLANIKDDNKVDIFDAILLAGAFNSKPDKPNWNPNADINSDNSVDIYDAILLAGNFNKGCQKWV